MKTLTKSTGLWTGSLQKHMAVSRRMMNKSYGLQQAQLARMNIVRDSQRLQLSAADTLVRLEQLKDEIKKNQYKPPPKVETPGIVPNSNPALASTIVPYGDLYDEEEIEGKADPPTLREQVAAKSKSAPTSRAVTPDKKFKNKVGLTVEIPAKKAASPIKKDTKVSPTASEAPTVSTSTTAQLGETIDMPKPLTFLEEKKILKEAVNRSNMSNKAKTKALKDINKSNSIATLKEIESVLINDTPSFSASDLIGNGIKLKYQYSTRK